MKKTAWIIITILFIAITAAIYPNIDGSHDYNNHKAIISGFYGSQGILFYTDGYPSLFHYIIFLLLPLANIDTLLAVFSALSIMWFIASVYDYFEYARKGNGKIALAVMLCLSYSIVFFFIGTWTFFLGLGFVMQALKFLKKHGVGFGFIMVSSLVLFSHRAAFVSLMVILLFEQMGKRKYMNVIIAGTISVVAILLMGEYWLTTSILSFSNYSINPVKIINFSALFFIYNLIVVKGIITQIKERRLEVGLIVVSLISLMMFMVTDTYFMRYQITYALFTVPFFLEKIDTIRDNMNFYTILLISINVISVALVTLGSLHIAI